MSENTNKILWITAVGIVVTAVAMLVYWRAGKPTTNIYNNTNNTTLCGSSERGNVSICLDASANSKLGNHVNNEGDTKASWFSQDNLEKKASNYASLSNFDYNEKSGWLDYALLFDGVNDSLKLNLANIDFKDGMSLQLHVKPSVTNTNTTIISNGQVALKIQNNKFVYELNTGTTYTLESNKTLNPGEWYLVHITYNNDRMKIYINGQLDGNKEISGTIPKTSTDFTLSPNSSMEISSILVYIKDIDEGGVNQNTEAIYRKVYAIDAYIANFAPVSAGCELWKAPITGEYQFELWGAQGASVGSGQGGKGSYVGANIALEKDTEIYLCVGKTGTISGSTALGGQATDLRLNFSGNRTDFNSLKSRIMVAGAGGGGNNAVGGAGGALMGLSSTTDINGVRSAKGGSQNAGGEKAGKYENVSVNVSAYLNGNKGSFGIGGSASSGAAGGEGYYGGGSITNHGGAGGGSSYVSGYAGVNSILESSTSTNIIHSGSAIHYSNLAFYSIKMINGRGMMPGSNHIDATSYGQAGNGHARITYISSDTAGHGEGHGAFTKPGKPEIQSYTATSSSITATYGAVDNAANYICYYGETADALDFTGTIIKTVTGDQQCNIGGLQQNKDYFIRVDAINGDQITSSDVSMIHTRYTTPSNPIFDHEVIESGKITTYWDESTPTTGYECYVGVEATNQNMVGALTYDDGQVICSRDGLEQNTDYYFRLIAINGDERVSATVGPFTTPYATPDRPTFLSSESTYDSITARFTGSAYADKYTCKYGTDESNLEFEGDVSLDASGSIICNAIDLEEGTEYFFQTTITNGGESSSSDIVKIATNYQEPGRPTQISNIVTDRSITATFTSAEYAKSYVCRAGLDYDNLNITADPIIGPTGDVQCMFLGLSQHTLYYYSLTAVNGNKEAGSDVYQATTKYGDATVPTYKKSTITGTSMTVEWNVSNQDERYVCSISEDKDIITAIADPTIEGNVAKCTFTSLASGTTFYSRLQAINGDNNAYSDWHEDTIGLILPNITLNAAGDNVLFPDKDNVYKTPFKFDYSLSSDDPDSILGLAYCVSFDGSACAPDYTYDAGLDEDTGMENPTLTANNDSTHAVVHIGEGFSGNIVVESPGSIKVCAVGVTRNGRATTPVCSNAYTTEKELFDATLTISDTYTWDDADGNEFAYFTYSYNGDGAITVEVQELLGTFAPDETLRAEVRDGNKIYIISDTGSVRNRFVQVTVNAAEGDTYKSTSASVSKLLIKEEDKTEPAITLDNYMFIYVDNFKELAIPYTYNGDGTLSVEAEWKGNESSAVMLDAKIQGNGIYVTNTTDFSCGTLNVTLKASEGTTYKSKTVTKSFYFGGVACATTGTIV